MIHDKATFIPKKAVCLCISLQAAMQCTLLLSIRNSVFNRTFAGNALMCFGPHAMFPFQILNDHRSLCLDGGKSWGPSEKAVKLRATVHSTFQPPAHE